MFRIKQLLIFLLISIASVQAQEQKLIEIKLIYYGYFNENIHYKMPVLIELRDGTTLLESEIVYQKTGLINSECKVKIDFGNIQDGDYWIVVRASGFMPVATPNKVNLSTAGIDYDFTTSSDKSVGGETVLYFADQKWQVRCGDLDGNLSVGAFDVNKFIPHIGKSVSSLIPANDALGMYESVVIGNQEWMQKNLDVAYYRNGDTIYHAESNADWQYAGENGIGAWCYYNNDPDNGDIYGKLYNWYAVNDERGLAPEGWRVPSDDDWKELEMYLGMSQEEADGWSWRGTTEGAKLAGGYDLWYNGSLRNNNDFNSSGFSGLPGGYRDHGGYYHDISHSARLWSSTDYSTPAAITRALNYINTDVNRYDNFKSLGRSVRCIKYEELSLNPPTLFSPVNNSNEVLLDLYLTWDSVENATTYKLQVSDIDDFSNLIFDETGITITELEINDLVLNTEYFWRVKAVNNATESEWSEIWSFTTTQYEYVIIGDQVWMQKNLNVSHYRNGDVIPNVTSSSEWSNLTTGAWCYYNNDEANGLIYGKLYNWFTVNDERGLAPEGWHIPSDEEWKLLEMELGMSQEEADDFGWRGTNQGSQIAGRADLWEDGELDKNSDFNIINLNILPSGYRGLNSEFWNIKMFANFWTSNNYRDEFTFFRNLYFNKMQIYRTDANKTYGYSVRCIKDE